MIKEGARKLEDRPTEIMQSEQHGKKKVWKKSEQSLIDLWDNAKRYNIIHVTRVLKEKKKNVVQKK